MSVISKSFTATGSSDQIYVKKGGEIHYEYSGTYAASFQLEYSKDSGLSWQSVVSNSTANASLSGKYVFDFANAAGVVVRFRCLAYTSGTLVTKIVSYYKNKLMVSASGLAKVGATDGFTVAAASDTSLVTCAASQTAATCVIPIPYIEQGKKIVGFHLIGQVESAGGAVTVDSALRVMTAAAADVSDADVGSAPQVSASADAIIDYKNSTCDGLSKVVGEDENYYVLVTVTTAASTDVALQGVAIILE